MYHPSIEITITDIDCTLIQRVRRNLCKSMPMRLAANQVLVRIPNHSCNYCDFFRFKLNFITKYLKNAHNNTNKPFQIQNIIKIPILWYTIRTLEDFQTKLINYLYPLIIYTHPRFCV